jgi:Stress responsive A/B Barrel Domain.
MKVQKVLKKPECPYGMEGKISELKDIEVGVDVTHSDRSYNLALITKFESVKNLEAYQINPLHVGVSKYMVSVSASIVAVDFESS